MAREWAATHDWVKKAQICETRGASSRWHVLLEDKRPDEDVLVRRAQRGDPQAFRKLIGAHEQSAMRLALRLTGTEHEALDVCERAFLRAQMDIRNFDLGSSFYAWLYRVVAKTGIEYLRRKNTMQGTKFIAHDRVALDLGPEMKIFATVTRTIDEPRNAWLRQFAIQDKRIESLEERIRQLEKDSVQKPRSPMLDLSRLANGKLPN